MYTLGFEELNGTCRCFSGGIRKGGTRKTGLPDARAELSERKPEFSCTFVRERLFYLKNPEHLAR